MKNVSAHTKINSLRVSAHTRSLSAQKIKSTNLLETGFRKKVPRLVIRKKVDSFKLLLHSSPKQVVHSKNAKS